VSRSNGVLYSDLGSLHDDGRLGAEAGSDCSGLYMSFPYDLGSSEKSRLTLIEHATPTSAMHPPSAAEMVAPRLKSMPMADAVRRKVMML
jgi:hypothetical protein